MNKVKRIASNLLDQQVNLFLLPVKSKLQHPHPPGKPREFDAYSCPKGGPFDHHSLGVGNLIASLDIMLRVVLLPSGLINHGRYGGDKL